MTPKVTPWARCRRSSAARSLFNAVFRLMQAMGVNALDKAHPVEKYLREAAVFPLYDAGNIGMQMRKIWGVMMDPTSTRAPSPIPARSRSRSQWRAPASSARRRIGAPIPSPG